jgi:hypothetical protein
MVKRARGERLQKPKHRRLRTVNREELEKSRLATLRMVEYLLQEPVDLPIVTCLLNSVRWELVQAVVGKRLH